MRSRSSRGSISSIYSPVNEASVTLARSEPEPFTHNTRTGYPRKSVSRDLAEVLPPPQLQIERSAPNLRERATSCDSTVDVETSVIASYPFINKLNTHQTELSLSQQRKRVGTSRAPTTCRDSRWAFREQAALAPRARHSHCCGTPRWDRGHAP